MADNLGPSLVGETVGMIKRWVVSIACAVVTLGLFAWLAFAIDRAIN